MIASLADVATDLAFAVGLSNNIRSSTDSFLLVACIIVLSLSVFVNIGGIVYFIWSERRRTSGHDFTMWLGNNATSTAALLFLTATNLGVLRGVNAKLFNLEAFNAPLSPQGKVLAGSIGLLSNLSEDLPQLLIQASYVALTSQDGVTLITTISLTVTVFAFLAAVVSRLLKLLLITEVSSSTASATVSLPMSVVTGSQSAGLSAAGTKSLTGDSASDSDSDRRRSYSPSPSGRPGVTASTSTAANTAPAAGNSSERRGGGSGGGGGQSATQAPTSIKEEQVYSYYSTSVSASGEEESESEYYYYSSTQA